MHAPDYTHNTLFSTPSGTRKVVREIVPRVQAWREHPRTGKFDPAEVSFHPFA